MGSCTRCQERDAQGGLFCSECSNSVFGRSAINRPSDDFPVYRTKHLDPFTPVARLTILDSDLTDISYPNVIGRFRRLDRSDAQTYFSGLLSGILQERLRQEDVKDGSFDEYRTFEDVLVPVAEKVSRTARPGAGTTPETLLLLRKSIAQEGAYLDMAELAHVQPRTALYGVEVYAALKKNGRAPAFSKALSRGPRDLLSLWDQPVLMVPLRDYQEEFLNAWLHGPQVGILEMATGTGKTVVALGAIAALAQEGPLKVLITAPSHAICDQWRSEIRTKLGLQIGNLDFSSPNIQISVRTIQSLARRPSLDDLDFDLLIMDEVHHVAGPEWRKAARVPAPRKLGLSATIPREARAAILKDELGPVLKKLTLGDALKRGILPEFDWFVHPVELSPAEANEFRKQTQQIRDLFQTVRNAPETRIALREIVRASRGKFALTDVESLSDLLDAYEWATMCRVHKPDGWITLFGLVQARQWISHRSIPKVESALRLIEPASAVAKCMVTTMDIETAEDIGARLPPEHTFVVHSEIPRHEVQRRLQAFKNAKHGALIAPKLLDEGIDVPDASIGFNVAGTKSRIQLVQRLGRILRPLPGKEPVFHHFITLPPKDLYVEGIDDLSYVDDLLWVRELGRAIGKLPKLATPELDEKFLRQVRLSGYRSHARRLARADAKVELPSGSIRFEDILKNVPASLARAILPALTGARINETNWTEIARAYPQGELPQGYWWLYARFREEPETLRAFLQPLAEEDEKYVEDTEAEVGEEDDDEETSPVTIFGSNPETKIWNPPEQDFAATTTCPECHDDIIEIRHLHGRITFDVAAHPWEKHACDFDSAYETKFREQLSEKSNAGEYWRTLAGVIVKTIQNEGEEGARMIIRLSDGTLNDSNWTTCWPVGLLVVFTTKNYPSELQLHRVDDQ